MTPQEAILITERFAGNKEWEDGKSSGFYQSKYDDRPSDYESYQKEEYWNDTTESNDNN